MVGAGQSALARKELQAWKEWRWRRWVSLKIWNLSVLPELVILDNEILVSSARMIRLREGAVVA